MKLDVQDLRALGKEALDQFEERVGRAEPGSCFAFDLEVARLESQLIQLYGVAAILARREESMEGVAALWGAMIGACDAVAARLLNLMVEHPACSASHDKILDLRNRCARLRDLHR
ncbi:MAG: hypothetical protein ACOYMV_05545 [Verrucomicrobiia bacterium]